MAQSQISDHIVPAMHEMVALDFAAEMFSLYFFLKCDGQNRPVHICIHICTRIRISKLQNEGSYRT